LANFFRQNRRKNLGSAWSAKGAYDKAIAYYEQAYQTVSEKLGENHPSTKTVKENLAEAQAARLATSR
jgi:tetratricopeptide (TPR) repeat protein